MERGTLQDPSSWHPLIAVRPKADLARRDLPPTTRPNHPQPTGEDHLRTPGSSAHTLPTADGTRSPETGKLVLRQPLCTALGGRGVGGGEMDSLAIDNSIDLEAAAQRFDVSGERREQHVAFALDPRDR